MKYSYPKSARLLKRREFEKVIRQGARFSGKTLYIDILSQKEGAAKLGITVVKKFGDAPTRNYFKRCVREAFRHFRADLKPAHYNIRPKIKSELITLDSIKADLLALARV